MLKTGCLLKCNAFIQYSELLTSDRASPGQLQGPSMPDSTVASSRCNKELETLCASPTYPSGSSPTTKIVNEHELIHQDIKRSFKCSKIRPSQYYCYYNKPPALSNFEHQFFFQFFFFFQCGGKIGTYLSEITQLLGNLLLLNCSMCIKSCLTAAQFFFHLEAFVTNYYQAKLFSTGS